jgi:hypothetical protein
VLLYSLSKASFNVLARIFDTWPSLVYCWIVETEAKLPTAVSGEIKELEFDEILHFIGLKKEKFGSSKHLSVAEGEL